MELSSVIGFTIRDGKKMLDRAGVAVTAVKVTSPPKMGVPFAEEYFRILKIRQIDSHKVELIVCKPL